MGIKIGDKLVFRNFHWEVTNLKEYFSGYKTLKYKVKRKYFKGLLNLSNTKCTYEMGRDKWNNYKLELKRDKNFHYTELFWSGARRFNK